MQRFVVLVLASAMVIVMASPSGAASADVRHDRVAGTATHLGADFPFPQITVRIRASSDGNGSNPRGVLTVRVPDIGQRRRGEVTCLSVQGNTATIGIRIVKAEDPTAVGKGELFKVVDNGATGDQIAGFPLTATAPTVCPPLGFSVPVVSGDYRVVDAAP